MEHNRKTEKRIRLGWDVPNLDLRPYKNGNQDEIQFIYNLKMERSPIKNTEIKFLLKEALTDKIYNREVYRKGIDASYNYEGYSVYKTENLKNIELIYWKDELIGFYNGKEEKKLNILFWGGDKRYLSVIQELSEENEVDLIGYNSVNIEGNKIDNSEISLEKYKVIILPMNGISNNMIINTLDGNITVKQELLNEIDKDCIIITGLKTRTVLNIKCKNVINLLDDLYIKEFNTNITIDGIIDFISKKEIKKIRKISILGYGNIGKKLYGKLEEIYNDVQIVAGEIEKEKIDSSVNIFDTENIEKFIEEISTSDIIINTVPKNIICKKVANRISKNTYILDIASYPYGIDNRLVEKYKLNYDLYLGIPGKYEPEKSGTILREKIKNIIEGVLI